ncbi:NUDIX hydrolase [Williamsia sp. CHRR-6]|uniref:NUDIX hydrolase n=1 Tax=Williamsia sp. CHRR-6 TaxID=2835871 RepID=UPI001BD984FA|nr:NUDIX hydrolase [Williamsia sp. CHRR-6]MBT0567756.1 NUDIX hydrolase [Williamsia sp. CHRR-6]
MSAEPSEPNPDVAGRPRHRRGKRRGGRRRSATATPEVPAEPAATEPSATSGAGTGEGRSRSRRGRRGRRRSPSRPPSDATTAALPDVGTGASSPVKPSDISARRVDPRAGTRRTTPASTPDDPTAPRLRTVRETSAGGLVVSGIAGPSAQRSAALIGRMDRRGRMMWSLPKGHIETGETAEQTAMREVAEETGIEGNVIAPLGKIEYWFVSEGKRIHKTVHHYLMRHTGGELSDADYEVAEVAWVPLSELPKRLTYSDERRLARAAADVIDELAADPELMARSEADSARTEPNEYERAAAARNQRRNEPARAPRPRRRRRGSRRGGSASPGAVEGSGADSGE